MATQFFPGYTTSRKDLALFLADSNENPVNAYEISYALYYVDPGPPEVEVLIGSAERVPVNPQVGEYWAALMVPPSAQSGTYRIRWTFRQYASSAQQTVTQEFSVAANEEATTVYYSAAEQEMIDKLRVLLRDQCVGGEETVELDVDGEYMVVRMDDLWEILQFGSTGGCEKLRAAFLKGTLRVQSVSPEGVVEWRRVVHVQRAEVPWETIIEGTTDFGPFVLTAGHRVFMTPTRKEEAQNLSTGGCLLGVSEMGGIISPTVQTRRELPKRQFMYDMTAEEWHNFVLHRSRVVVSNSPDKFYHFRPPEHSGRVGNYDRVFGQIWEDAELKVYLDAALDWWNMFPPSTFSVGNINLLVNTNATAGWKTAVLWGAIVHALFAVALNWVADEFDYSIGGVSLSLEKSSKYESLKQNAESQFDKATEAKARTVKYIRGLQQPKYGLGIRSAFGPHVGRGVLSPRNFL